MDKAIKYEPYMFIKCLKSINGFVCPFDADKHRAQTTYKPVIR